MRIQLILVIALTLISSSFASEEKKIKDLFEQYQLVMDKKKVELIDEVFTKKFLKDHGGKEEFIQKVKELPKSTDKGTPKIKWKKGSKGDLYFAHVDSKKPTSQFVLKAEDGKLKIDGTMSDAE